MRHICSGLILCACAACLAGCVSLSKPYPVQRSYRLSVAALPCACIKAQGTVLRIQRLTAASCFEGSEFVYRRTDNQWQSDFMNRFLAPPAELIQEQLAACLAGAGPFAHVTGTDSHLRASHILEVHLDAVYADLSDSPVKSVIRIRARLLNANCPSTALLDKTYSAEIPLPEESRAPDDMVNGWNSGMSSVFRNLSQDMAQALGGVHGTLNEF